MKNKEKYLNEIIEIAKEGEVLAVDKETDEPCACRGLQCSDCALYRDCHNNRKAWLEAEAESEEMRFAKTCKRGDIVEVSDRGEHWVLRRFACVDEDGVIWAIVEGDESDTVSWVHIRKPISAEEWANGATE